MWWLLPFAYAQSEVCSPHPVERWAAEIDAVAEAQQKLAIDRSGVWLEAVAEGARCLSDVAPVALLARYAELQAVQAMYDQDQQAMEAWIRYRRAVGGELPWRVSDQHPIHRFAAEVREVDDVGVGDRVFAPPKKGGVFVDGAWCATLRVVPDVSHLVQRFDDDGERVDAAWVLGASVDPSWLTTGAPAEPPRWFDGPGVEREERPTWKAARKDTLKAYEMYLAKEPTGEHASEARRRIDDLRWAATPKTAEGAQAYLDAYPKGRNRGNAEAILQGIEFEAALQAGTREALQLFLGRYPRGVFAVEAQRRLEAIAWARALAEDTEQSYARYRVRWPGGAHWEAARLAQDERAWAKTHGGGRTEMQAYLRAWPNGTHAEEAQVFLDGLSFVRVHVAVGGSADPEALEAVASAAPEVLDELGLTVVDEVASGVGRLEIDVSELDVGVGLSRFAVELRVRVDGLVQPLLERNLLIDPLPASEALAELDVRVRRELLLLRPWVAQP